MLFYMLFVYRNECVSSIFFYMVMLCERQLEFNWLRPRLSYYVKRTRRWTMNDQSIICKFVNKIPIRQIASGAKRRWAKIAEVFIQIRHIIIGDVAAGCFWRQYRMRSRIVRAEKKCCLLKFFCDRLFCVSVC